MSLLKLHELIIIEQNLLLKLSEINELLVPLNKQKVKAKKALKRLNKRINQINEEILGNIFAKPNGVDKSDCVSDINNCGKQHCE